MTKAELLAKNFARCFREYRSCTTEVRETVDLLVTTATDPAVPPAERADAISALANLLFPNGIDGGVFSDRVTRLLRQKGMTQRELANIMGVSEPVVSQILSGRHRPRRRTVNRIAAALGVQPDEL